MSFSAPLDRPVASRRPRIVPNAYVLLSNWRYLEHGILRVIAGWGRTAGDWEDKLAVCYHVWLQAEATEKMRRRLDMFPGGKKDGPVDVVFERLLNTVLLAPSFPDAMAGVRLVHEALTHTYRTYRQTDHPIHDRPTHDVLREVLELKRVQLDWHDDYRQRHPSSIDSRYIDNVLSELAAIGGGWIPIECGAEHAALCGTRTDFRMDVTPGRPKGWNASPDVVPFLEMDWSRSVEARRLYFMIGYMREMGVAEDQLRWIYHADFMPFEFTYAEARHMWDESRHGDSGLHRLQAFGLDLAHVYYDSYGKHGGGKLPPMSPRDVYDAFYNVTQVAESGFFETKRYCFEDFRTGGDEASEEMMQFDIIDETGHVEYGRLWLEDMGCCAGVDEDYRARGRLDRAASQRRSDARVAALTHFAQTGQRPVAGRPGSVVDEVTERGYRTIADPKARRHYEWLLAELRGQLPLRNLDEIPERPNLPL